MLAHRPTHFALIAVMLFWSAATASADVYYETTYLPTTSILSVPATRAYPTTYVLPTSNLVTTSSVYVPTSTSYVTTSYRYRPRRYLDRTTYFASPTYYSLAPTSYLSSSLLPTSYVTSSLLPTSYLTSSFVEPTSYVIDSGLVRTSATVCCEEAPAQAPVRTTTSQPLGKPSTRETITSQPSAERRPTGGPSNDEQVSSAVNPPVTAPSGAQVAPKPVEPTTPPNPTPYDPATKPAGEVQMPDPGKIGTNPGGETMSYNTRRPAFGNVADVRNILRGKVISYETSRPAESVTVVVSSRTGSFVDRTAMSDADGEFKVSLPDGDWTVKVKMASGSILTVNQDYVTASGGRVIDASGRLVKEFLIRW